MFQTTNQILSGSEHGDTHSTAIYTGWLHTPVCGRKSQLLWHRVIDSQKTLLGLIDDVCSLNGWCIKDIYQGHNTYLQYLYLVPIGKLGKRCLDQQLRLLLCLLQRLRQFQLQDPQRFVVGG